MTRPAFARNRTLSGMVIVMALLSSGSRCGDDPQENQLIWQDEFDGPAGPIDTRRWRFDVGTDWGNAQLEYDTNRIENASIDGNGHLVITARRESYRGRDYTSARINTRDLFAHERGRFEARIRLPIGQGLWPAFWLLGADFGQVGWPECGEIDIMEYRGQEPGIVHGSVHGPGYSGAAAVTRQFELSGRSFHDDFHLFAVEWEAEQITWLVDNIPYHTVTPADLPVRGRWVFDHPFFIILNVAVGGNFVGPPNESTVFPQTMLVDWVRVFRNGS